MSVKLIVKTNLREIPLDPNAIRLTGRAGIGIQLGNLLKFRKGEYIISIS